MIQPSNSNQGSSQPSQGQGSPLISVSLNAADLASLVGVGLSLVCAVLIKRLRDLGKHINELQRPSLLLPKEMSRVQQLLAQLAVLTGADRVLLGLYHNGSLSSDGYHMSKLAIIAAYYRPGITPVSEGYRQVPIDAIPELRPLWISDGLMTVGIDDERLSSGCRAYMELRDIKCLRNITLRAGAQVEVGVLGLHYCCATCPSTDSLNSTDVQTVVEELSKLATLRNKHQSVFGAMHLQR